MATTRVPRLLDAPQRRETDLAQGLATAAGFTYLLAGLLAWLVTDRFVGRDDANLFDFHVNGLHNVVHLGLGVGWLVAGTRSEWARTVNAVFGGALVLASLLGFLGLLAVPLNVHGAGDPDNLLHLGTGLAALWFSRLRP